MNAFTNRPGMVMATARLNLRRGLPSRSAPVVRKVDPGTNLRVIAVGPGEVVSGNGQWFAGLDDTFFWSGACGSLVPDQVGAVVGPVEATLPAPDVARRPNNTILPLSDSEIREVFGNFSYAEAAKGAITILGDWASQNIVKLETPLLSEEGYPHIKVHKKAAPHFKAAFDEIVASGLTGIIRTCAGTFVPRHKGWDPARGLSSHSWGVAIDVNVAWNGYGRTPAPLGSVGSLYEIVPIMEKHGFAWGGYFSSPYEDGMHFELARRDA